MIGRQTERETSLRARRRSAQGLYTPPAEKKVTPVCPPVGRVLPAVRLLRPLGLGARSRKLWLGLTWLESASRGIDARTCTIGLSMDLLASVATTLPHLDVDPTPDAAVLRAKTNGDDATPPPSGARTLVRAFAQRPSARQSLPCAWLDWTNPTVASPPGSLRSSQLDETIGQAPEEISFSLADLSADGLSLNRAYGYSPSRSEASAGSSEAATVASTSALARASSSSLSPISPATQPIAGMCFPATCGVVGRFHLRCRATSRKRGEVKTGQRGGGRGREGMRRAHVFWACSLVRSLTRRHLVCLVCSSCARAVRHEFAVSDQSEAAAATRAASATTLSLGFKCCSYNALFNRYATYRRGRYGCVMLSPTLGFVVTACGQTLDLVMMSTQDWDAHDAGPDKHPPFALADDTCYVITFLSASRHSTVACVRQAHTEDVALEWNHPTSHPQAASVISTPQSSSSSSSSRSETLAGHTHPSSSISPCIASITEHQSTPSSSGHVKVSCVPCRVARARCDQQRSGDTHSQAPLGGVRHSRVLAQRTADSSVCCVTRAGRALVAPGPVARQHASTLHARCRLPPPTPPLPRTTKTA